MTNIVTVNKPPTCIGREGVRVKRVSVVLELPSIGGVKKLFLIYIILNVFYISQIILPVRPKMFLYLPDHSASTSRTPART